MKVQFTLKEEDIKAVLWAYNSNIEDLSLNSEDMDNWIVDFEEDCVTITVAKEL